MFKSHVLAMRYDNLIEKKHEKNNEGIVSDDPINEGKSGNPYTRFEVRSDKK